MSLIKAVFLVVPVALSIASVDAQEISTVQEAARERVKEKMGDIRGTLTKQSKRVFLTDEMIELRKPIRQANSNTSKSEDENAYLRLLNEAQQESPTDTILTDNLSTAEIISNADVAAGSNADMDKITQLADAVLKDAN